MRRTMTDKELNAALNEVLRGVVEDGQTVAMPAGWEPPA